MPAFARIPHLLILTGFWLALTGSLSILNLLLGLVVAALALVILGDQLPGTGFRLRPVAALALLLLFLKELMKSAWRVATLVLDPRMSITPAIVVVPVSLTGDAELTLLANLITLTPGTLTVDVAQDRRALYVHALEADDPDRVRRDIRAGFERAIREAFR
nr:Na+/H+ antiporter subunit E [uncultured Gellertiella sp.]